jgi:hypothetical protein
MDNILTIDQLGSINEDIARKFFKNADVDHTYGIATSVCSLLRKNSSSSNCKQLGVIRMANLGLDKDNFYTFKDVVEASLNKGYSKITASDSLNYLVSHFRFGCIPLNESAVTLMDEVIDGEGDKGVIFIRSDGGFLRRVGFFTPDNSKTLSAKARFLVGKN